MNKNNLILITAVVLIIASGLGYYLTETGYMWGKGNTTITDMAGRNLTVPSPIDKVLSTSPTATGIVYMVAPEKLLALNYETTSEEQKYMPDAYKNLPSVGGWYGSQSGSYEQFISMDPDVILESIASSNSTSTTTYLSTIATLEERQKKFGSIPVVGVNDTSTVTTINPSIEFIGKLLGNEDKANKLVAFNERVQKEVTDVVSTIPDSEKVKVYYAEGSAGLQTDPPGAVHGQLIDFCGGKNVADVQIQGGSGKTDVSMEQVLTWDPEVIITTDSTFYANVYNNSTWSAVTAVKNKRVYLSPQSPFKWFDRPTGANMIIGIPWVAKILYPDKFQDLDLTSDVKEFYSEFYHYDLSDDEVKNILEGSGMNSSMIS
ncbi:ABC transporter substrate-binding protein [Methanobacterium ferruginis]|jgi:iron complex transport system substrate-binding protein|uniref:ABC transporter substrate-binding protein n=1 Tax=Methanobacterium ferruginis TaxID=710191 RepID=UPI0025728E28|nr:ABC transporter substrate-binding protein [Methanobacterium ferruginis]MCC7550664.1 ABC transporter substrate-binding protein [Methanobacterium sp.]BDZ67497.1 iron ABC transporter substrate-binding protein [Methanobacterium ferruginis]